MRVLLTLFVAAVGLYGDAAVQHLLEEKLHARLQALDEHLQA